MFTCKTDTEVCGAVEPPRLPADHPDHGIECEVALEAALISAIDRAGAAGWKPESIWPALRSLVANLEQAAIENRRTDRAIADAWTGLAKAD